MEGGLTQEQLNERWTLATGEHLLLMSKSGPGRLGFAVLLKFFQDEAQFPPARARCRWRRSITSCSRQRLRQRCGPSTTDRDARSNTTAPRSGRSLVFEKQRRKTSMES
jgi:hypothetical protein